MTGKLIKKAGGAEQYNANQKAEPSRSRRSVSREDTIRATSARRPSTGKRRRASRAGARAAGRRASRMYRVWRSRAKILVEEVENNLDNKVKQARWNRWNTCSLCEQRYHGVVRCALGWACWKASWGGRRRTPSSLAMSLLGTGLTAAARHEDVVRERGRVVYAAAHWCTRGAVLAVLANLRGHL